MYRKSSTVVAFGLALASISPTFAADSLPGVELWLPKSYQTHYLTLVEAAKKIQREPECWQLLNGRLHESKSTPNSPIFYFRCRDSDRKSFAYTVDADTMTVFNLDAERKRLAQEKAAQKADDAFKQKEKPFWEFCHHAIKEEMSGFNEAKIISDLPPAGKALDNEAIEFKVDVNSLSFTQKVLRYTAYCTIKAENDLNVEIKRRKQ